MNRRALAVAGLGAGALAAALAVDHVLRAPRGEVDVVVRPRDARVWLDDDHEITPPASLSEGRHAFEVTRPGYALTMFAVTVAGGRVYNRAVVLRPLAPERPPPGLAAIVLDAPTALRGVVTLDGQRVAHIPARLHVPPGTHVVAAQSGADHLRTALEAEAGTVSTVYLGAAPALVAVGVDAPNGSVVVRVLPDGRVEALGEGTLETLVDGTGSSVRLRVTAPGGPAREFVASIAGKARVGLFAGGATQ